MDNHIFFMGKLIKWPFSIAMLVYQRIIIMFPKKNAVKPDLVLTTLVSMAMIHDSVNPIFSTPLVPPIIFLINIP